MAEPIYQLSVLRNPMSLPPRYLASKLTEPLPTTDGGTLRTICDAVRYMTALPKQRELNQAWQYAARLISDNSRSRCSSRVQPPLAVRLAITSQPNNLGRIAAILKHGPRMH